MHVLQTVPLHRFEANAPLYIQVSRDTCVLHLTEHHGDCCPGATAFVRVTGLDDFHREISAKDYRFMRPGVEVAPWNAKVMEVIDPSAIACASTKTSRRRARRERMCGREVYASAVNLYAAYFRR